LDSGAWTLPKNSSLELMSSVYSTLTPYSSSKALSDGRSLVSSSMSMYSVQFEMRSLSASSPVDARGRRLGRRAGGDVAAALLSAASLVAPPALDAALDCEVAGGAAALVASPLVLALDAAAAARREQAGNREQRPAGRHPLQELLPVGRSHLVFPL
jgi:hypothetical protein